MNRLGVLLFGVIFLRTTLVNGAIREKRWIPDRMSDNDYGIDTHSYTPGGSSDSMSSQPNYMNYWNDFFPGGYSGGDYTGMLYRAGGGKPESTHAMMDPVQQLQNVQAYSYAQSLRQQYPYAPPPYPYPPPPPPSYSAPYPGNEALTGRSGLLDVVLGSSTQSEVERESSPQNTFFVFNPSSLQSSDSIAAIKLLKMMEKNEAKEKIKSKPNHNTKGHTSGAQKAQSHTSGAQKAQSHTSGAQKAQSHTSESQKTHETKHEQEKIQEHIEESHSQKESTQDHHISESHKTQDHHISESHKTQGHTKEVQNTHGTQHEHETKETKEHQESLHDTQDHHISDSQKTHDKHIKETKPESEHEKIVVKVTETEDVLPVAHSKAVEQAHEIKQQHDTKETKENIKETKETIKISEKEVKGRTYDTEYPSSGDSQSPLDMVYPGVMETAQIRPTLPLNYQYPQSTYQVPSYSIPQTYMPQQSTSQYYVNPSQAAGPYSTGAATLPYYSGYPNYAGYYNYQSPTRASRSSVAVAAPMPMVVRYVYGNPLYPQFV